MSNIRTKDFYGYRDVTCYADGYVNLYGHINADIFVTLSI